MSLRYIEDVALMQQTVPTATKGVDSICKYYKNATNEVKNLLQNECDVIMECRYFFKLKTISNGTFFSYCKNLFRSIINFVTHKRTYCRSLRLVLVFFLNEAKFSQSVSALAAVSNQIDEVVRNVEGTPETRASEEKEPRNSRSSTKPQYSLRRVNLNAAINKHVEKIPVRVPNSEVSFVLYMLLMVEKENTLF